MTNFNDDITPYINIGLGLFFTLVGFKVFKPFAKEKEEETYKKYGGFFKIAGIALLVFGIYKLISM